MHKTLNWKPPSNWLRITTLEAHTAGEPLRVVTSGYPNLPGETILEKRRYARQNFDHLRTAIMWEPRGHADMYGCLVTEPVTPDGTLGVLFMHNEGYSTMCGHGIIGLAKVILDTGMIQIDGDELVIKMDTPAGRVTAYARRENGIVKRVSFHNVHSFVYALDQAVEVPGLGTIHYDVAFGGAFYAYCRAEEAGVGLIEENYQELIDIGVRIKHAVMDSLVIEHPFEPDLSFLYGTIFIGGAHEYGHHSRNVCVFADGEVDRCPTGTGLSGRAAIHYARGELDAGEPFVVESILGTCFTGEIIEITKFGPYEAVIPKITGTAHICGRSELLIDPDDPLRDGFILR
ncbi:proline racemase family protein [Chloroflexota bacterium]